MKVPPKRKGNAQGNFAKESDTFARLNESPSEKEGKFPIAPQAQSHRISLNESPSEKEGKCPPKEQEEEEVNSLNESPSEKEGKS